MIKQVLFLGVLLSPLFIIPNVVSAQVVSGLQANVSTINSGQPAGFSWSLSNALGSWFVLPCQTGITATKVDDGSTVTCGTKYFVDNPNGGAAGLLINNLSGSTKSVTVQVIPKDLSGNEYTQGTTQTQVSVYTHQEPITEAKFDIAVATSGNTVNLSWTGVSALTGVNIQIFCNSSVYVTSTNYTETPYIPCGKPVFSSALSGSGSVPLVFTSLSGTQTMSVQILPVISTGSYDGTHAKTLSIDIVPKAAIITSIDSFTASSTTVLSGNDTKVTWSASNASGVNFHLACDASNIAITSSSTGSSILSCNRQYILSSDAAISGSLLFDFKNLGFSTQQVTLTITPAPQTGSYDGTKSKTLNFSVLAKGASLPTTSTYTPPNYTGIINSNGAAAPTPMTYGTLKKARVTFNRMLKYGIVSDDVKALQEFLAKDPSIYPEGLTTGFYGPMTTRAIQRFQSKYGIITSGTPETTGYGWFGPKTRAFVNANFK